MKKLILLFGLLLTLPFVSAKLHSEDIHLSRVRIGDYGLVSRQEMDTYVYVYNDNPDDWVKSATVSIRIMDADIYDSSGVFDVKSKRSSGRNMITEHDLAPGEYLVKISLTANDIHRTKYRYMTIV
ncbi:MAG: hypothetical protein ABIG95_05475 [Candidatus Woesearchaeota archaeon]